MKLESHRDMWTNKPDYWWSDGKRIISPYFASEEEANRWKKEREESTEWDSWKPNRDLR
jgi:hypothetical protein